MFLLINYFYDKLVHLFVKLLKSVTQFCWQAEDFLEQFIKRHRKEKLINFLHWRDLAAPYCYCSAFLSISFKIIYWINIKNILIIKNFLPGLTNLSKNHQAPTFTIPEFSWVISFFKGANAPASITAWVWGSSPVTILPIDLMAGLMNDISLLLSNSTSLGTTPASITFWIFSLGPSVR